MACVSDQLEKIGLLNLKQGHETPGDHRARVCNSKQNILFSDLVRVRLGDELRDNQVAKDVGKLLRPLSRI